MQPPTPPPIHSTDEHSVPRAVAPAPWRFLQSGPGAPAFNMALDEALLEAVARWGQPVLRFYGWTVPAATFGYFQKYAEIERLTRLRPLIRRPTGGGLVPHDADWTYSLAFPAGHAWHSLRAEASYRRVHEWVCAAFHRLNVDAELAPAGRPTGPGQCFVGYEKFDVLWRGRKIAGAAQRRTRAGLLIQGSVQPPPLGLAPNDWWQAMRETAQTRFHLRWTSLDPDAFPRERAEILATQKYAQAAHNQRR